MDAGLVKMGFPHSAPEDDSSDPAASADPPITVCMWSVVNHFFYYIHDVHFIL